MSRLTRPQAQRLTELVALLRDDWDLPGIRAAVARIPGDVSAVDAAIATVRATANRDARTPALIPEPGAHWQTTSAGKRHAPVMCADHPRHKAAGCQPCRAESVPVPPDVLAQVRTTVTAARQRAEAAKEASA
jgi:hypothetical protein